MDTSMYGYLGGAEYAPGKIEFFRFFSKEKTSTELKTAVTIKPTTIKPTTIKPTKKNLKN